MRGVFRIAFGVAVGLNLSDFVLNLSDLVSIVAEAVVAEAIGSHRGEAVAAEAIVAEAVAFDCI